MPLIRMAAQCTEPTDQIASRILDSTQMNINEPAVGCHSGQPERG